MTQLSWLRSLSSFWQPRKGSGRRARPRRAAPPRSARLRFERLEERLALSVELSYYLGTTNNLWLTEQAVGSTPSVTIYETEGVLTIDLGASHFVNTSTPAGSGLSYNAGSPGLATKAYVDTSSAGNIATLFASFPGDVLNLGHISDQYSGLENLSAGAQTLNVTGFVNTEKIKSPGKGNVTLSADQSILVSGGIKTSAGNIKLYGNAAKTSSVSSIGIEVKGATIQTTGSGSILLEGYGGNSGDPSYIVSGVELYDGAKVEATGSGTVSLYGTGGNGMGLSEGVSITDDGTQVRTASGDLYISGAGGQGPDGDNVGIEVCYGAQVSVAGGAGKLTLYGTGGPGSVSNNGIDVYGGARVSVGGTGALSLTGTGGGLGGMMGNKGVWISGNGTHVWTAGGSLSVTGTGGEGHYGSDNGIEVTWGAVVSVEGTGTLTLKGTSGPVTGSGNDGNYGVYISGDGALVSTAGGDVSITGTSKANGETNVGVYVSEKAKVSTGDAGKLTLIGTANSSASGTNMGVSITGQFTQVMTAAADLSITGTAGDAGAGILVDGGALVSAGSSGKVTLNGSGGVSVASGFDRDGKLIAQTHVSTVTGDLFITGKHVDVFFSTPVSSSGGNITIGADEISILGTIDAGSGIVTFLPQTFGGAIDLGSKTNPAHLGVLQTDLNHVTAGILRIGGTSGGSITITAPVTDVGAGWSTLSLVTGSPGSTIAQSTSGTALTVTNLLARGLAGVSLPDVGNGVSTLAGATEDGAFYFVDAAHLTVGTVDSGLGSQVSGLGTGIITQGQWIRLTVTTAGGSLTVNQPIDGTHNFYAPAPGGANISLIADTMTLSAAVTAGSAGIVDLQPVTAGRAVNLGTKTDPTRLGILQADLNYVTAGRLQLNSGNSVTITAPITDVGTGWNTLYLYGGSTVTQSNSGTGLTVAKLSVFGVSGVFLTDLGNDVSTLAGATENGGFHFVDTASLTVGIGTSGILTQGQPISLTVTTEGDSLTINQLMDSTHNFHAPAPGGANISLVADRMKLSAAVNAGTVGLVELMPFSAGRAIDLGTKNDLTHLGLLQSDLNHVTAGMLLIGSLQSITITAPITDVGTGWNALSLLAGATVSQSSSGTALTIATLGAVGFAGVTLDDNGNNVATLAGATVTGPFSFIDAAGVTVGIGTAGILSQGQPISLTVTTAGDSLTVNQPIESVYNWVSPAPGGADIHLRADVMTINAPVHAGTSIVTLTPQTAGTPFDLGGNAGMAGALAITNAALNHITALAINLGDNNTGTFTVSDNIQHAGDANLNLTTGRNLVFNPGTSLISCDGNLVLQANTSGMAAGDFIGIDVQGAAIKSLGAGSVSLNGTGGSKSWLLEGPGGGTGTGNDGIRLSSAALVSTATGALTLLGTGGVGSSFNSGVAIGEDGAQVRTGGGGLTIVGTGRGIGDFNDGIDLWSGAEVSVGGMGTMVLQGTGARDLNIEGVLKGSGVVIANTVNGGQVGTGSAMGSIDLTGGYAQTATGELEIKIGGPDPGQYDQLTVTGAISLDGSLHVQLVGGFNPTPSQKFTIIDGSSPIPTYFANLPEGAVVWDDAYTRRFRISYLANNVVLTALDDTPPSISAPPDITVSHDPGEDTATITNLGVAIATDDEPVVVTNDAPAAFPIGITHVTWTATDASGNTATATQTVTVINHAPVVSVPGQTSTEGQAVILDLNTFVSDPDGDPVSIAVIGLPAGLSFNNSTGVIAGTLDHAAAQSPYTVTVVAADPFGGTTSTSLVWTVERASTTTNVVSSLNPSPYGLAVTFTATVSAVAPGGGTPDGQVTFLDNGTPLGTATLDSAGVATLTAGNTQLASGSHTITVTYAGNANYVGSSGTMVQSVLSPSQQTTQLVQQVNALVSNGVVTAGNGKALNAKLEAAIASLNGGKTDNALSQLNAFINQVNAFVKVRKLAAAQGQPLLDAAYQIIASIQA